MPRRLGRLALRLALLAASIVVSLLVAELLVRLLLPQPLVTLRPDIWIPVEGLGHHLAPDLDTTVNTGEGEVRLLTDAAGHRVGGVGAAPSSDAGRRILALGDSFLEALQVEYEETMTALLAERLAASSGEPLTIVNTGVGAWNPSHYLIEARRELAGGGYGHVLTFLFLGNDLKPVRVDSFPPREPAGRRLRPRRRLTRREMVDAIIYPAFARLRSRSHLVVLVRGRASGLLRRLGLTKSAFPTVLLTTEAEAPVWEITAGICEEIAAEAAAHGATAQFVLVPSDYQVDPEQARAYARGSGIDESLVDADQPARILTERLRERDLEVIDLTGALRAAWRDGSRLYGRIDRHFTPEGHRVVAETLYPHLRRRLFGPGEPRPPTAR